MTKSILLMAAIVASTSPAIATPVQTSAAAENSSTGQLQISKGMKEAEVTKLLGAPLTRSKTPWGQEMIEYAAPKTGGQDKVRYLFDVDGTVLRSVPYPPEE